MNFKNNLKKYAELTVTTGINIQKDQVLYVSAPIEVADFVRLISKAAYNLGAKEVIINWVDLESNLIRYNNADESVFSTFSEFKADSMVDLAKNGAAFLTISAPNPDIFKDVNPDFIVAQNKATSIALEEYRKFIGSGNNSWGVIVVPTEAWSTKVFPDKSIEDGLNELWNKVFSVTRVDTENPTESWKQHIEMLKKGMDDLNNKQYTKLHFKAPGTDLSVELPKNHLWIGGGLYNNSGTYFVPNLPTEEIFTAPHRLGVNGTLSSTRPLNYGGSLIENFSFTFENGKIVDFSAEVGYETLKRILDIDEGASYLGEVALVPDDSPVSNTNTIYYNTLFDENASCHFAIGRAYASCIENGTKMENTELLEKGINTSLTHIDFMVGSKKLQITGELDDGSIENIFINGNWA